MPRSQHPCALWLQLHTSHPPPLPLYFIFTLILLQCCHQHSTAPAEEQAAVSAVLVRVGTQDTSTKPKYGCHHEHCKSGALFTPCYLWVLHFAHFDSLWPYSTAEASLLQATIQWWTWPGGDSRTLVLSSPHTVDTCALLTRSLCNISQTLAIFCYQMCTVI